MRTHWSERFAATLMVRFWTHEFGVHHEHMQGKDCGSTSFWWPDVPSYRQNSRTLLQIGEDVMDDEMRREFSKLHDALIHVGAKNDFGWISFAFTVNYVLLGIILWRLFG
jgi:hypothetical protein